MREDMNTEQTALTDWLEARMAEDKPLPEILEQAPELSMEQAYRIQFGLMDRRVTRGERIVGYKAALTSKPMQKLANIGEPLLGTLMDSRLFPAEAPLSLGRFRKATLEPEIAVRLGSALKGPGIDEAQALAACDAYFPAVEIGDYLTGDNPRSLPQTLVCNTFNGGYILGPAFVPPTDFNLWLEGMVMAHNGEIVATATAAEVLGEPMRSVAFMANKVGELGREIPAGSLLLTGSIVKSIELHPGDTVDVDFTRLGRLALSFTG